MDTEDGEDNDIGRSGGGGGGGGVGLGIGGLSGINGGTTIGRIDVTHHRDRMRTRSVSPTYIIQLDHPEHARRSSVESVISCQRNGESPQIRILNEVVQPIMNTDSIQDGHKKQLSTNSNTIRIRCGNGCMSISKHHSIDDDNGVGGVGTSSTSSSNTIKSQKSDKLPSSLSLPCTLKKCRGNENCNHQHSDCNNNNNGMSSNGGGGGGDGINSDGTMNNGSTGCSGLTCNNNCYVWTLDFQELNKKIDIYEKGHSSKFTDNRKSANYIKTTKTTNTNTTADDDDDDHADDHNDDHGDGVGHSDDQICLSDENPSQDNIKNNSKEIKGGGGDKVDDDDDDEEEIFDNLLLSASSKVI